LLLNVFVHFYSHSPEYSYDFCLGRAKRAGPGGDLTDLDEDVSCQIFPQHCYTCARKADKFDCAFPKILSNSATGNREIGKHRKGNGERGTWNP